MKAIVLYGPNDFRLEERETPKPGRGEVLCRVKACAICGSDPKVIAGKWKWTRYPMIPGHEWTGVVEEVGEGVDEFSPGDRVSVEPHKGCGTCFQCATGNYTLCENYGRPEKGHIH
ncbi:MAG: alcohol dehydrogenase catalytic domain-containing protein, partial [Candidatus Bathyarchaeia archaeon]